MKGEIPPGRLIRPKSASEFERKLKRSPQYAENKRLIASQSDEPIRAREGVIIAFFIAGAMFMAICLFS